MAQPEIIKDIEARVKDTGDTMTGNLTVPTVIGNLNGNAITADHFKINKITSGADLNNLTPYLYADGNTSICSTLINKPSDMPTGEISINTIPLSYNSYIYSVQTIIASNSASNLEIYVRKHHNDTFGDWKKLLTSSNYSQYALPLTGGTLTGGIVFTGSNGIQTRHIDGESTTFGGDLYLNYGVNAPIHVGNGGSYTISADGSYYSGISNKSKSLFAFKTSSEPNNTPKYKLILTKKVTPWTNHRATFSTSSRHTGNGILSIAFGCDNGTVSDSTIYGQIIYFGNSNYGAVWNNDRFILYYNNTNQEFYLFCKYYDYGPTTLTLLNSYTSGSGGQIVYDDLIDGAYIDSFNGYGIQVCQSIKGWVEGDLVTGAVWNDYAEYRKAESIEPGRVVVESADGEMKLSTERLQPGAEIISDTFGFAIGETDEYKTPIAATGRVLAYPNEDRYSYPLGCAVCSGPNGTVSQMTREEIREYPERIIGTVSEIPEYKNWGTGNVEVDGRIWIRIK